MGGGERKEVRKTLRFLSWETGKIEMQLTQMEMRRGRPFWSGNNRAELVALTC